MKLGGFARLVVWKWMDDGRMGAERFRDGKEKENDRKGESGS